LGLTVKVEDRLDAIERELAEIKAPLSSSQNLKVVKLKGLWKGLRVDDRDVEAAKKSLFKHGNHASGKNSLFDAGDVV
jgi:hypothetical protein